MAVATPNGLITPIVKAAHELGVAQVNRQDIAGFSSQSVPSNYALLGPPGWAGARDGGEIRG